MKNLLLIISFLMGILLHSQKNALKPNSKDLDKVEFHQLGEKRFQSCAELSSRSKLCDKWRHTFANCMNDMGLVKIVM